MTQKISPHKVSKMMSLYFDGHSQTDIQTAPAQRGWDYPRHLCRDTGEGQVTYRQRRRYRGNRMSIEINCVL